MHHTERSAEFCPLLMLRTLIPTLASTFIVKIEFTFDTFDSTLNYLWVLGCEVAVQLTLCVQSPYQPLRLLITHYPVH